MQFATLSTRQKKDNSINVEELSSIWLEKIKELNINIEEFKKINIKTNNTFQKNFELLSEIVSNSIEHITERQTTFTKEQLINAVVDRSKNIYSISEIEIEISKNKELVSNNINSEQYSKHLKNFNNKEKIIYTTQTQINIEKEIENIIKKGNNKFKSISSNINKNTEIDNILFSNKKEENLYLTLNNNQKDTVNFILDNKDQFIGIQGFAGMGKTYTIKALNEKLIKTI